MFKNHYGWVVVGTLSITQTVGFGVILYSFGVFITPMQESLGWSRVDITGAQALGMLIGGLFAAVLGRWIDRFGGRWIMTIGSIICTLLMLLWSVVDSLPAFYALWIALGMACEAVLYSSAFIVVVQWFKSRRRSEALTTLTFIAGFASVIFLPLCGWLVEAFGWREALLILSIILAVFTIPLHAFVLRDPPRTPKPQPAEDTIIHTSRDVTAAEAFRRRDFWWMVLAFSASTFVVNALLVHLVPLLIEANYAPTVAAGFAGAIGVMALPGRVIFTPLGSRISRHMVMVFLFVTQCIGVLMLALSTGTVGVWAFVVLYGMGFGAITPARAAIVAETFGAGAYGEISGRIGIPGAVVRAISPVMVSAMVAASGSYTPSLFVLVGVSALAAFAIWKAKHHTHAALSAAPQHP